jgi:hypothetical protein
VGDGDHDSFLLWAALVWIFAVSVFLLARDNVHHGHDSTIFVNFELINFILKCRLA